MKNQFLFCDAIVDFFFLGGICHIYIIIHGITSNLKNYLQITLNISVMKLLLKYLNVPTHFQQRKPKIALCALLGANYRK